MAQTLTSTIVGSLNTEYISRMMKTYARNPLVFLPHVQIENLDGRGSVTASFMVPTKDAAAAVNENADITATAFNLVNVDATVAEVGISRDVSKRSRRANIMGEAGLIQWLIEDGGRLCFEKMEQDAWAIFPSASNSVGTTATAMTLSNFAVGYSTLGLNNAMGQVIFFGTGKQMSDLREGQVASTGAMFMNGVGGNLLKQKRDDGYCGDLLDLQCWTNNLAAAANAGADKVGAFAVSGMTRPEEAPVSGAVLWWPEVESVNDPSFRNNELATTACYAFIESLDRSYVKVVTRAS